MLLEIMLKHVQVHTSAVETQQVPTNGNFVIDFALLVKPVINLSKRCQKSVMDCVSTHPSLLDLSGRFDT